MKIVFLWQLIHDIYHEDDSALLVMDWHTGIYFQEQKIWKTYKHSLKYKILEEELSNCYSEVVTWSVLQKSCS